jgi:aminocarboxymuconate-semialdehyde decarboxylase
LQQRPVEAFRRFCADTASFGSRITIECGLKFFGADRVMFGTDMPFDPEQGPGFIRSTLRILDEMDLSDEDREKILNGNARRLLRLTSCS